MARTAGTEVRSQVLAWRIVVMCGSAIVSPLVIARASHTQAITQLRQIGGPSWRISRRPPPQRRHRSVVSVARRAVPTGIPPAIPFPRPPSTMAGSWVAGPRSGLADRASRRAMP